MERNSDEDKWVGPKCRYQAPRITCAMLWPISVATIVEMVNRDHTRRSPLWCCDALAFCFDLWAETIIILSGTKSGAEQAQQRQTGWVLSSTHNTIRLDCTIISNLYTYLLTCLVMTIFLSDIVSFVRLSFVVFLLRHIGPIFSGGWGSFGWALRAKGLASKFERLSIEAQRAKSRVGFLGRGVSCWIQSARVSGERCKLSQCGLGQSPSRNWI